MMVASGAMAGMSRGVAGLPARGAHHGTATHHHGLPALVGGSQHSNSWGEMVRTFVNFITSKIASFSLAAVFNLGS